MKTFYLLIVSPKLMHTENSYLAFKYHNKKFELQVVDFYTQSLSTNQSIKSLLVLHFSDRECHLKCFTGFKKTQQNMNDQKCFKLTFKNWFFWRWGGWRCHPQLQEIMNKHSDVRLKQQTCCQLANKTVSKSSSLRCVVVTFTVKYIYKKTYWIELLIQYINTDKNTNQLVLYYAKISSDVHSPLLTASH